MKSGSLSFCVLSNQDKDKQWGWLLHNQALRHSRSLATLPSSGPAQAGWPACCLAADCENAVTSSVSFLDVVERTSTFIHACVCWLICMNQQSVHTCSCQCLPSYVAASLTSYFFHNSAERDCSKLEISITEIAGTTYAGFLCTVCAAGEPLLPHIPVTLCFASKAKITMIRNIFL